MAGVVGAVFNGSLQIGASIGFACITSIQTSIDKRFPGRQNGFAGRAAAFWFVLATNALIIIITAVFYRTIPARADTSTTAAKSDVENAGGEETVEEIVLDDKSPVKDDIEIEGNIVSW
jgi:hypothetical protein